MENFPGNFSIGAKHVQKKSNRMSETSSSQVPGTHHGFATLGTNHSLGIFSFVEVTLTLHQTGHSLQNSKILN